MRIKEDIDRYEPPAQDDPDNDYIHEYDYLWDDVDYEENDEEEPYW